MSPHSFLSHFPVGTFESCASLRGMCHTVNRGQNSLQFFRFHLESGCAYRELAEDEKLEKEMPPILLWKVCFSEDSGMVSHLTWVTELL